MKDSDRIPWEDHNEMWSELAEVSSVAALTPEERFVYEEELRNKWDLEATYLAKYQEGEAKGEDNKAREIARSLLTSNMSDEFVVKHTGLSLAEVQKLRARIV